MSRSISGLLLEAAGHYSKKVPGSLRARRGAQEEEEEALAMALAMALASRFATRGEWYSSTRAGFSHLHDALEGQGSERREGIRQGSEKPRQEHTTLIASISLEGVIWAPL